MATYPPMTYTSVIAQGRSRSANRKSGPISRARVPARTRLYRWVEAVGRWSNIDVFMISLLVALVQFGVLATVEARSGAVAFAAVVLITMFASQSFDPRLMWDAAEGRTS